MYRDFVLNGQPNGEVANAVAGCRFDSGLLRPYIEEDGHAYMTVNTGRFKQNEKGAWEPEYEAVRVADLMGNGIMSPVANATSLRKDEWIQLDRQVLMATRKRLRAWADLSAANSFGGFDGMSKTVLEHETMSDPGEAMVDMDGTAEGRTDQPKFQLEGLPLPITHSSFTVSKRKLATSRNSGTPFDTVMGEAAGRRVAEAIEKTLIGVQTGMTYGTAANYGRAPTVYGYLNHPARAIKNDMTAPTSTNGTVVVDEVLALRELLYNNNFFGPFNLYVSTNYDQYLDNDFKTNSDKTTRQRILEIDQISSVKRLDYLSGTRMILVQMTSEVARAVNGMAITTVQWESKGGLQLNFKVMGIQVPQIRADINGNSGIAVGTTS